MNTDTPTITIRNARAADVADLARLITALSYPTSPAEMATRFEALALATDFTTLVAVDSTGIVGMLGMQITPSFERNGLVARVHVLVVDEHARSKKVGRRLMEAAERFAEEKGARRVVLSSSSRRAEAHRFYDGLGYERTGIRFTKRLRGDD